MEKKRIEMQVKESDKGSPAYSSASECAGVGDEPPKRRGSRSVSAGNEQKGRARSQTRYFIGKGRELTEAQAKDHVRRQESK